MDIVLKILKLCACSLCFIGFIGLPTRAYADGGLYLFPTGAKAVGMGNNGLLNVDTWAVYNNQAALAFIENINAGLNYENRFAVNQFGISAGAVTLPALTGTFGFDIAQMGMDEYGETRIGVGYGKKLAKNLSLGIQFNYHLVNFSSGYPDFHAFTGEVGLIAEPLENLLIGAHVFNPTFAKLNSRYEDPIPVIFKLGAGYKVVNKLMLVAEVKKERSSDMSPSFGVEYSLFKNMNLRSGISLKPTEICFGVGWIAKKFHVDFAFYHHEILGYCPQIGISHSF
jgi:hypothetical protein